MERQNNISKLIEEGFEERPYGLRKIYEGDEKRQAIQKFKEQAAVKKPYGWERINIDDEDVEVIEIAFGPGKNTGIGSPDLDDDGLRGHPGLSWNYVMHNGYVGDSEQEDFVLYFFKDDDEILMEGYRQDDIFPSVVTEEDGRKRGYCSIVFNASTEKYARLLIAKKPE